jgi:hypothetical protein
MHKIIEDCDILQLIAGHLRGPALIAFMNTTHVTRNALIGIVWPMFNRRGSLPTSRLVSDFIGHIKYNYSITDLNVCANTPVNTLACVLKEFCPLSPMPPRLFTVDMAVHIVGTISFTLWVDGSWQLCVRISRELGQFLKTLAAIFNNPVNRDAITSRLLGKCVTSGGYSQRVLNGLGNVAFTTQDTDGKYIAYLDTLPGYMPTGDAVNLVARINTQYKDIRLIAGV